MDTVGSFLAEAVVTLEEAEFDEPRRRVRALIASALNLSLSELLIDPERPLDQLEAARLLGLVNRMARGEPLSRVLGRREFWGLDFTLSDETLDPRPESETIVETVLARIINRDYPLRLLDLGTGTGCLLLALLSELPSAIGYGVDISQDAVATARRNAEALGLAPRAQFCVGNWGGPLAPRFDVIVANPPYIATAMVAKLPREVKDYDPAQALDGGEDGLAQYRMLAAYLPALLAPFAIFVGEMGEGQADTVVSILRRCGLILEAIERDFAGRERCIVMRGTAPGQAERFVEAQKNLGMRCSHV